MTNMAQIDENYGSEDNNENEKLYRSLSTDHCHIKTENDIDGEILLVSSAKIKEEDNWETNADADETDPLKIDEDIADGAIIKFEKDTLPKIEVYLKEEPPWEDNSDMKSDIDERNFEAIEVNDGVSFAQSSTLTYHKRANTDKKPINCKVCGKSFQKPSLLKLHERTHTGEKPHSCDICGQSFGYSNNVIRHKRIHTGEKPYICDICGKSFSQSNTLNEHKTIHTGVRPFSCNVCSKLFRRRKQLKEHIMLVHTRENKQIVRILREARGSENRKSVNLMR